MKILRHVLCCLLLPLAVGCATPQKLVDPTAKPEPDKGYVAGIFSGFAMGFAFAFVNLETQREYLMPFFRKGSVIYLENHDETVQIIALPPGVYELASWVTYDFFGNVITTRKEFPVESRATLKVTPGKTLFVGRYEASQHQTGGYPTYTIHYRVRPRAYDPATLERLLTESYPYFSLASFEFVDYFGKERKPPVVQAESGGDSLYGDEPEEASTSQQLATLDAAPEDRFDVTGTYVSNITSNNHWVFKGKYKQVRLTLRQQADGRISVTSVPAMDLSVRREGNLLRFDTGATLAACGCAHREGQWQVDPDSKRWSGSWASAGGGSEGSWTLTRID